MLVSLTYRRTSRLSVRIGVHGDVRVSAPIGTPRTEVERFVREHEQWIRQAQERTRKREERNEAFYSQLPINTTKERREAVARLNSIVHPIVCHYAPLMNVQPTSISYRATRTRWGSCQPAKGAIHFSLYLLLLPPICVEHVVVHELAHLLVPNHSARFYAVMDRFFPRWQFARQEAKRVSRMETEE